MKICLLLDDFFIMNLGIYKSERLQSMKISNLFACFAVIVSGLLLSAPALSATKLPSLPPPIVLANGEQENTAAETPWVGVTESDLGTTIFVSTGKGYRTLVSGWDNISPSLSPDGNMVTFISDRPDESRPSQVPPSGGGYEVWAARTDGSSLRRLTSMGKFAAAPSFGPDGRWVYFSSSDEGLNFKPAEIMRVSITGIRGPEPILKAPQNNDYPKTRLSTPRISSDGKKLFFTMSEIPCKGAMTYGFMAVFSVELPENGQKANLDDADKIAGGAPSFDDKGKPVGTMASAPAVTGDGRLIFVSYEGRTETSIAIHDGKTSTTLLPVTDSIHVSPSMSSRGATLIYGRLTEEGVVWIARNIRSGVEAVLRIAESGIEGRLIHAGY